MKNFQDSVVKEPQNPQNYQARILSSGLKAQEKGLCRILMFLRSFGTDHRRRVVYRCLVFYTASMPQDPSGEKYGSYPPPSYTPECGL